MSDQVKDPAEGQDNPDEVELSWVPEKFRRDSLEETTRALLESQNQAQRKITEQASEKRALEESIQTLAQQFEEFTAAQSRPDPSQVNEYWQNQYDADPLGTMAQIAQATAQQILQAQQSASQQPSVAPDVVAFMADQTMNQTHEDWHDYKEKVADVIAQNPLFQRDELWSNPQAASQALDSAYKMVKAEAVLSGATLAEQQAADTRAMKLAAQSAVGASGRTLPSDDAKAEWERIKNAAPKRYYE